MDIVMFNKLNLSDTTLPSIEWDMTPDLAFCTFSAKGLREELTSTSERVCYFFIDNWGDEPKLYLMERGVRHVNILAEIAAPRKLLIDCIVNQGGSPTSRDNFPVDSIVKDWLLAKVVEADDSPFLIPLVEEQPAEEDMGEALPKPGETGLSGDRVSLPLEPCTLEESRVELLLTQWNFFDSILNPQGKFNNYLADSGDGQTVIDERTGIMWQRGGLDLCSIRSMNRSIEQLNEKGFAGFHDWRMPTLEEAMSLMEPSANAKGVHLHLCFSKEQPFIFVSARRKPTGYWFVDYKQGKIYWSSGTVPGGFCKLCRRVEYP